MAKRAKSISLTPRKKKTRGVKTIDAKHLGDEPTWEGAEHWEDAKIHAHKARAYTWYSYFHKGNDLNKNLYAWMKETGYLAAEINAVKAFPDNMLISPVVYNATMLLRGMPDKYSSWLRDKVAGMIEVGTLNVKAAQKEKRVTKNVYKPTIQDRMREQLSEIIGEIDTWEDEVFSDKKYSAPKMFEWLKAQNVAQTHINKIIDYYKPKIEEITEIQSKNADDDLKEGFNHLKPADIKRIAGFYDALINDLESYQNLKKVTRKARAKKAPSKDKLVQKLKYKLEDNELKITSISPVQIIGASSLWVYNTKTRKLGQYKADPQMKQLTVKGSTIIGFDEKLSVGKTIRKPVEQLKEFSKSGKVKLRSFLDDINAVSIKLTGRVNKDTILLRVD